MHRAVAADGALNRAADLLANAERPLMVLGSQVMLHPRAVGELVAAVERLQIPVYLSGMARGLLGAGHPLQRRHKRRKALKGADVVLLAGGSRATSGWTMAPTCPGRRSSASTCPAKI